MITVDSRESRAQGPVRAWLATSAQPGAVAVIELSGDVELVLGRLVGSTPPVHTVRLASLGGIDHGLIIRPSRHRAMLTPHGGLRIVERLLQWLHDADIEVCRADDVDPLVRCPEAEDRWEALALVALAHAASPRAIDLLLEQPARWRRWADSGGRASVDPTCRARSARLNRLLDPPLVVVAGRPNVGKSTLTNRLAGRHVSIEADLPGTTRDYTAARIDLGGLVVNWIDTPGLMEEAGELDGAGIATARHIIEQADLLIALTDDEQPWPELPRRADLRVGNKSDRLVRSEADLCISAATGAQIERLVTALTDHLVPRADRDHPGLWFFDARLLDFAPPVHRTISE